ncbi:hypothetical protein [Clostridium sp.]|uniref:hypothetical protein n=1 Tax=Clostridium sp. TaxID=1506 RepID=UPI0034642A8B
MEKGIDLTTKNIGEIIIEPESIILPDRFRDLTPCVCPQNLPDEAAAIDAATVGRVINFNLLVRNLCPNKPFIVCIVIYKIVGTERVVLAQIAEVVTNTTGTACGDFVRPLTAVINEPICSNQRIFFHTIGNYVNCCNVTLG